MSRYQLRVFIFRGRDLPSADQDGTSDPYLVVSCAGQKARTTELENKLNPGFFETVYLDVEIPDLEKNVKII